VERAQKLAGKAKALEDEAQVRFLLFFFFIALKPRVEEYTKSMSLKYEPASEPLHISVK